ncbi:sugar transferase [Bacteroides sp.]|jgi:undecaprenyl phosphate N,N'-diacetylbacillosamine 1-phosphate transferase|uniref:sugar transferase n=1 Tax=Bacteroides sp. TaxID=29523 RepID=UPI0025BB822D|nr:sugar transferase [Bacteroides sp.]
MYNKILKRLIDIVISLMLIPLVLVLMIPIALFIKLEDHGDVFYNAERYGLNMRKFRMFKFRSMKMNAPDIRNADGTTFNSEKDIRLTRIGSFLRKTSIDELPQILNVFLGDMSFVGPRPSPMGNERTYTDFVKKKFDVRPGITGYNQALLRNSATLEERYKNDIYYAENLSFLLDCKIIYMTLRSVLCRENVYKN